MGKNLLTLGWVKVLNDHGINTVPMSSEQKMPLIQTSQYWSGFPLSAMKDLSPKNIAALPGLASRLLVLDLDGPQDKIREFLQTSSDVTQHPLRQRSCPGAFLLA